MTDKPLLAVTAGDPAGIGPEICVKALTHPQVHEICQPLIIGHPRSIRQSMGFSPELRLNLISDPSMAVFQPGIVNCLGVEPATDMSWPPATTSAEAGLIAYSCVEVGINLALAGKAAAVVTAPINKKSLHLAGFKYAGHTEIFRKLTGSDKAAMLLVSGNLRVIHVTTHMSMLDACRAITKENVLRTLRLADEARRLLSLEGPIAVAGLNAHCSEDGLFGNEEATAIEPAIGQAISEGIPAEGPVPADTVFIKAAAGRYDLVVAMYHDQGHIPVKMHGFQAGSADGGFTSISGVNCTVGLPIIRTSVDHGTAFDLAGKGCASEQSLLEAMELAALMARRRGK